MKRSLFIFYFLLFTFYCSAQSSLKVYPTNWWVGMKLNKIQLMIHEEDTSKIIAVDKLVINSSSADLKIIKVNRVENRRYIFVDVAIAANAKPQIIKISFGGVVPNEWRSLMFELKTKRSGNGKIFAQGVTSSDLVYLIMPDRFSNGDKNNDKIPGMLDQSLNRDTVFNRHGGDLKGVQNHLDYLKDLGVTTVWLTPVIENDMPRRTEHGYAFTNHYQVDKRIGGNDAYKNLVDAIHAKGMKIIQDAVYNHVGIKHVFIKDMPMKNWVHQWPKYTNTTYKDQTIFDPHGAAMDKKKMTDGWFEPNMADLNEENPYVANFLIEHAVWSVEEFGVDGWRIDTYSYNNLEFMNRCNQALYDEYPNISLFGETWVHGVPNQSYFAQNNYNIPFKSNLQATTDFQLLFYGIQEALTKPFGWTDGVNKLYTTTAQDFVYKDPMREVIFLDNHDLPRFYSVLNEDTAKYKMAFAWLMTFRGVAQMYYGSEILMAGLTSPNDGQVRKDFPGGWEGDADNKFTAAGRTAKENSIFNYIKTLANFRKNSSAIKTGKLMQYVPEDGVYVYFRYDAKQTVMCIFNQNDGEKEIDLNRFDERTSGFTKATDIISGETISVAGKRKIAGKTLTVFELKN
ncbi:MAG: alpha-amylase family glycosyl hydrolase [Ferruginibacter sp.]